MVASKRPGISPELAEAMARTDAAVARALAMYDELLESNPAAAAEFVELVKYRIEDLRFGVEARALIERVRRASRV